MVRSSHEVEAGGGGGGGTGVIEGSRRYLIRILSRQSSTKPDTKKAILETDPLSAGLEKGAEEVFFTRDADNPKTAIIKPKSNQTNNAKLEDKNESQALKARVSELQYKSYSDRWWLLLTVVLLNLANYSHWVAFPSVTKVAAKFYDQSGSAMDLIPTLSYGLGVPCCILATYVVERHGLKNGLQIGGSLTGIGGLFCFLSSLPWLSEGLSSDSKYYLALLGQALTGVACPFISCVPTKISQHWFGDSERTLATILIGMTNPLGIALGQALTPLFVRSAEDVPLMNIVWFIPAGIGSILTIWKVTANRPPTPPSPSAANQVLTTPESYWPSIKSLLTNRAFMILFFFIGAAMGYVSTISTKIEQILCARGYSDQLSGLSGSLILTCGFISSFAFGLLSYKTGRLSALTRLAGFVSILAMILMAYFFRHPNFEVAIPLSCALLGTFALGVYPLALELVVEATYPVDQATGTAFIFLSSAFQGVILMLVEGYLGPPLSDEDMEIQTCIEPEEAGHEQPKDYSNYLNFITGYMTFFILVFIFFFRTEMKRTMADTEANIAVATINKSGSAENGIVEPGKSTESITAEAETLLMTSTSSDSGNSSHISTGASSPEDKGRQR